MGSGELYVDPKIRRVLVLYGDLLVEGFHSLPITKQLELLADRLTEAHRRGNDAVCFQIGSWHSALMGKADDEILASAFTLDDARMTIAREHGFTDWTAVRSLADEPSDTEFEDAVSIMMSGDLSSLAALLKHQPRLLTASSRYGHHATLLHYVGTNGVESYRQVVPPNLAAITELLLASGADPQSKADIYGGTTPRELFESSNHTFASNVHESVVRVFESYGVRSPSSQ